MRNVVILLFIVLFCTTQKLSAQMYFFATNQLGTGPDSSRKQGFKEWKFNYLFNTGKKELLIIDGVTGMTEQIEELGAVTVTKKSERTEYDFEFGFWTSLFVIDYKDPTKPDEMKFLELDDEISHYKGEFHMIYLKRDE